VPLAVIALEVHTVCMRLHVGAALAILFGLLDAIFGLFLSLVMSGKEWQDRARARRMAEHRMNARLLRLNL